MRWTAGGGRDPGIPGLRRTTGDRRAIARAVRASGLTPRLATGVATEAITLMGKVGVGSRYATLRRFFEAVRTAGRRT